MMKTLLTEMFIIMIRNNMWPCFWELSSSDTGYKTMINHMQKYQYLNIYEEN